MKIGDLQFLLAPKCLYATSTSARPRAMAEPGWLSLSSSGEPYGMMLRIIQSMKALSCLWLGSLPASRAAITDDVVSMIGCKLSETKMLQESAYMSMWLSIRHGRHKVLDRRTFQVWERKCHVANESITGVYKRRYGYAESKDTITNKNGGALQSRVSGPLSPEERDNRTNCSPRQTPPRHSTWVTTSWPRASLHWPWAF